MNGFVAANRQAWYEGNTQNRNSTPQIITRQTPSFRRLLVWQVPSLIMASSLSPAKVLLLAVHFAAHADISSLASLTRAHASIIQEELLLRILLTHLPETVRPDVYTGFLQEVADHTFDEHQFVELDTSPVNGLDDNEAAKRVTKHRLLPLTYPSVPQTTQEDALSRFLFLRTHQMDNETGMLAQLLDLLLPFLSRNAGIHKWTMSTVLPYVRKGLEHGFAVSPEYSLLQFENLPDARAVEYLLSSANSLNQSEEHVHDHLKSLIGPWIHDTDRWNATPESSSLEASTVFCSGWQQVCEWLLSQATLSWPVAIHAIEHWGGPEDVDFGLGIALDLPTSYKRYLRQTYATTVLACVYSVQEASYECLSRICSLLTKLRLYLGHESSFTSLEETIKALPNLSVTDMLAFRGDRVASYMRNDLLERNNPLTKPSQDSTTLLLALTLSACILTLFGSPSSVRRVGDLTFLRDERDQKSEALKILRAKLGQASRESDDYLLQVRSSLLWLRDWGHGSTGAPVAGAGAAGAAGTLGMVSRDYMESEFLKLLLSRERMDWLSLRTSGTQRFANHFRRLQPCTKFVRYRRISGSATRGCTGISFPGGPERFRQCHKPQPDSRWFKAL
jgi:hypothetical protein